MTAPPLVLPVTLLFLPAERAAAAVQDVGPFGDAGPRVPEQVWPR
jgi:hypothetical protein